MQNSDGNHRPGEHKFSLDMRRRASISGVEDVRSFNENELVLATTAGEMTISGTGLNVSLLNLEDGNLIVEGDVNSIDYSENRRSAKKTGFFGRMLR